MARNGEHLIPRRATRLGSGGQRETRWLSEWRELDAYVLLGDPGAGKSTAFQQQARADADNAFCLTARDLVDISVAPEHRHKTLFIDALDEMRAGSSSPGGPLGDIRRALHQLDRPRFRLSCREADWLSADQTSLQAVARGGEVAVLHLEPLSQDEIRTLLQAWPDRVSDPQRFLDDAERMQMSPMLGNPLLLNLLVDAVQGGAQWPGTRTETYQLACQHLVAEHDENHRHVRRQARADNLPELLAQAGRLCTLLLANKSGYSDEAVHESDDAVRVDLLPRELEIGHAGVILASKLFSTEGRLKSPRHRTLAEYLAGRELAHYVRNGLPIGRVLALMSGPDGGIVEPLRGLHAWLAVHSPAERPQLIDRDPLGIVLYGDVRSFSTTDKRHLLDSLQREAQRFQWFRNGHWESHPFGALATRDMRAVFAELLAGPDRSQARQSLLGCVLDAIRHGEPMPELAAHLENIVRDAQYRDDVRGSALQAWAAQPGADWHRARTWLDEIRRGEIGDPADQLLGKLLKWLYPKHLSPAEIFDYHKKPQDPALLGSYAWFWRHDLLELTPVDGWAALASALARKLIEKPIASIDFGWRSTVGTVLQRALQHAGDATPIPEIYAWLGMGLDEYDHDRLNGTNKNAVQAWLGERPETQKALLVHGLEHLEGDPEHPRLQIHRVENHLYRARRPRDWYRWLLGLEAVPRTEIIARYTLQEAAHRAINPTDEFDISMEEVEAWLDLHEQHWPQARQWLESIWWYSLDDWRGEEKARQLEYQSASSRRQQERRTSIEPHLPALESGNAPLHLLHGLAGAYLDLIVDVSGDTPEKRLQNLLSGTAEEVLWALSGLKASLQRQDLPAVDEILKLGLEGRYHLIRPVCLVGAELAEQEDATAPARWSDALAERLVAFRLSDGTGATPRWYMTLSQQRPQLVAEIFIRHVKGELKRRKEHISGLSALFEETHAAVTKLVLPDLLQCMSARVNASQLRLLNDSLLAAASRWLDPALQRDISAARLAKNLDAGQRIAWLVFALRFDPDRWGQELVEFVGASQSRAVHLGAALSSQGHAIGSASQIPPELLARLAELMAPHAAPERTTGGEAYWVTDGDRRRDLVGQFLNQLRNSPAPAARSEMLRLRNLPVMKHWAIALDAALYEQARIARTAYFQHASIAQVAQTLSNTTPANVLDLSALMQLQLRDIEQRLRRDNTNSLNLFWEGNKTGHPVPKAENDCRDVLQDKLADRLLQLSVQLEKEGQFANDKRADLKAIVMQAGRRLVLPVEIKKDNHPKLWTAWHEQLDGQYTIDPDAQGVGIYLVLWFDHQTRRAPEGVHPTSAHHLEELLKARIPGDDQGRLTVIVLDLSRPATAGAP